MMLNQDVFIDNILLISGGLAFSMSVLGLLYLKFYIFNKSNDNVEVLNENKVLLNEIDLLTNKDKVDIAVLPKHNLVVLNNERLINNISDEFNAKEDIIDNKNSLPSESVSTLLTSTNVDQNFVNTNISILKNVLEIISSSI